MPWYIHATPTFIADMFHLKILMYNCLKWLFVKATAYTALVRLVTMMCFAYKAMPTNDTDYRCPIKVVEAV